MATGIAIYEMTSEYPDMPAEMLASPALELDAGWREDAVMHAVALTEGLRLLRMIWSGKPTMVHPSHMADLSRELQQVIAAAGEASVTAVNELSAAHSLCARVEAAGNWLVSIGP